MGIIEWGAIGAIATVAGWVWYLASRLQRVEDQSHAASTLAAGASGKAMEVERDLAKHKEHVAAEYVSRDAMSEVTAAINRLGDRLDSLFIHFMPKP